MVRGGTKTQFLWSEVIKTRGDQDQGHTQDF